MALALRALRRGVDDAVKKSYHELTDEDLARICHEAHLALRIGLNHSADDMHFDALPQERKDLVINEVRMFREGKTLAEVHQAWVEWMTKQGWRWGIYRNKYEKIHPNLVPYDQLPLSEQAKVRQAQRIVFTHVMPEYLEEIAYKDIRSRSWSELTQDLDYDTGAVVCTAHMRFVPCRKEDGTCTYSEDPVDVDRVHRYQKRTGNENER